MDKEKLEQQVADYENDSKSNEPKSKGNAWKYVLNISFVLIATGLSIFFSIKDDAKSIIDNLARSGANYKWWFVVLGLVACTILIRSFILFCFARLYTKDYKFHQAIAVDQIGQFYNAVTPGASGGQIMQAYTYKKQGIPVSSAVSILAMYSIVFQSILIIYGLLSFIIKYDFITSLGDIDTGIIISNVPIKVPIWPLTIVGFLLNVGVILIVLLMGYWHSFHNFVMGPVISFLSKIKIVKDPNKTRESLRISVENFKVEFRRLLTNVRFTILVAVSFVCYMMVKFSIPFFVGKVLGNQSTVASFWDCIFLSNYHQMVTGLIPVPGSAGVSELFFYQIFVNPTNPELGFFYSPGITDASGDIIVSAAEASKNLCRSALLIWRFVTFTFPLLIAGLVAAFYRCSPKNEGLQSDHLPNRQTFVSLQSETLVQRQEEVEKSMETRTLSRSAIFKKLNSTKKTKKPAKPKLNTDDFDNLEIRSEDDD